MRIKSAIEYRIATDYDIIEISSEDDDEVEILEFRKITQDLINSTDHEQQPQSQQEKQSNSGHKVTKKLSDIQCPICFDIVENATTTTCGHIFCLQCIEQSISSSRARGQANMPRGKGLCPLCRKVVSFKETIILKLKKADTVFREPK
ncbi:hypothetical protein KGF56_004692 [Candida oxycetoniae]|uniref:RING-type domain-containing protein n=1 Tax=Candida oxycetoniae TaxID=497107 RepID=A0AAI9ST63_9ASCO|nr:uncharacterized protein KGF56_004692 [Candida oxycetoniae]KAI3402600.2 hypothetical protein KGF56_004692 [Candida oxycetoniae]